MRIESAETGRLLNFQVGDDLWYKIKTTYVATTKGRVAGVLVNNDAEAAMLGGGESVMVGDGFRPPLRQPFILFEGVPVSVWWQDVFSGDSEPLLLMHEPLVRNEVIGTARYFDAKPATLGESFGAIESDCSRCKRHAGCDVRTRNDD